MKYISTRGGNEELSAAEAIKCGLAKNGGLFVPQELPKLTLEELSAWQKLDYRQRAADLLRRFLTDYSQSEIEDCVNAAYSESKFSDPKIAPLRSLDAKRHVLELWHGPTSAFKDMALQVLPRLMVTALAKTKEKAQVAILVATSGDTGKAALEGFCDVAQTQVIVFYPKDGVSEIQRRQMVTQAGENVAVVAVEGNFDDAQSGVKTIFADEAFNSLLEDSEIRLSSANSINWGRLAPQIVYYFSSYIDLVASGAIKLGDKVNFVVPTGNFGNILAGYYALRMGLPVGRLICAANRNNVLSDFIQSGRYDRKREFHKTISPSMDILISSNLERMLYYLVQGEREKVAEWMACLAKDGCYEIGAQLHEVLQEIFWSGWVDDDETQRMIKEVYQERGYLLDPHTAVAWQVGEKYRLQGDDAPQIILSTASPFKFNDSVLEALEGEKRSGEDEFALLKALAEKSGWKMPQKLAELETLPLRHQKTCAVSEMRACVQQILVK